MNANDVRWDGGGPTRTSPADTPLVYTVPIPEKDKRAEPEFFRLLTEPTRVWTHYVETDMRPAWRSMPCTRECRWCPRRRSRVAYAPALRFWQDDKAITAFGHSQFGWMPVVVHLTEECWADLAVAANRAFGPDVPWRGLALQLQRIGRRLRPTIVEQRDEVALPEPWDVVPILMQIWGVRDAFTLPPKEADMPATVLFRDMKGGA